MGYYWELYNNSTIEPTGWTGKGQPSGFKKIPATKWYALLNDPDRYYGCEVYEFDSLEERKQFIAEYSKGQCK